MSVVGIASSLFSQIGSLQNNQQSKIHTEFQQLSQDLTAGNLSQAQADFAALQQNAPLGQANSGSPVSQALNALGNDLQSGNLAAAQQDFANLQQDITTAQPSGQVHHHHHHHHAEASNPQSQQNTLTQLFSTLGQDLQAGNLSGAQQAYAALQQDLWPGGATSGANSGSSPAVSLSA